MVLKFVYYNVWQYCDRNKQVVCILYNNIIRRRFILDLSIFDKNYVTYFVLSFYIFIKKKKMQYTKKYKSQLMSIKHIQIYYLKHFLNYIPITNLCCKI